MLSTRTNKSLMNNEKYSTHWLICKIRHSQLHRNCAADQSLYFPYKDNTSSLLLNPNFKVSNHLLWFLTILCGCTVQFVFDLGRNPEVRFSQLFYHFNMNPRFSYFYYMLGANMQVSCHIYEVFLKLVTL